MYLALCVVKGTWKFPCTCFMCCKRYMEISMHLALCVVEGHGNFHVPCLMCCKRYMEIPIYLAIRFVKEKKIGKGYLNY